MKTPSVYTKEQKLKIEALAQKGTTDSEIYKITKVSLSSIQTITTNYWKRKMQEKYEFEN